ncbi:MAG TPA: hypothetical protein VFS67_29940 [Polyangiaceae bacterium]|nr:hypothetical protein [Polyangiaceae bacterium]
MMRISSLWLVAGVLCGCMPMGAPAQQINDVARDVNVATRFGRMDVAMEHTSQSHRGEFMRTRADWGKDIRVLDVELSKLELQKPDSAEVLVDVSWMRMNEGVLRSTRVKQHWVNNGDDWQIDAEERSSGDIGLLGENVVVLRPDAPRDVHFPVKTLGQTSN